MTDVRQLKLLVLLHTFVGGIELDLLVSIPCRARVAEISTHDLITCHHNVSALSRSADISCVARLLNSDLAAGYAR